MRGLQQEPSFGRGGLRVWAPVPPALTTTLPTPPSAAVAVPAPGCAPAASASVAAAASVAASGVAASDCGSACVSVSAKRTAKTSPPSPEPEDQPAAKRRAYPPVDLAGSPYPENQQRRAYQEAQVRMSATYLHGLGPESVSPQAAVALLQHGRSVLQHARSAPPACHRGHRAQPPAAPLPLTYRPNRPTAPLPLTYRPNRPVRAASHPPLPAVERAVLEAKAEAEVEGQAMAETEAEAIERGGQGEGGHSEGELDRMLQEQLARLRSSWS